MKQGVRSSGARCVLAVRTVQSTFRASPSSLLSTHSARRPQPGPAACPPSQGSASPEPRGEWIAVSPLWPAGLTRRAVLGPSGCSLSECSLPA